MAAQSSAGEGVGLRHGGWTPTVVYDAPIMLLLGVLGVELPGHLTPPQAPWVPPLLEEEVNRTQLPPL